MCGRLRVGKSFLHVCSMALLGRRPPQRMEASSCRRPISASTAYAVVEVLGGTGHSFNRTIREAPLFYAANVGMALLAG